MAGGNTNPLRQQMINMMYLVLTALLALNVSADILKAFALVNAGLEKTNDDYQDKNNLTMTQFAKMYNDDKEKAQHVYAAAQKANGLADKLYDELQGVKDDMALKAGGWINEGKTAVENDQDLEIAEHYFLVDEKGKKGEELLNKLKNFETEMYELVIDEDGKKMPKGTVKFNIDTQDPPVAKDGTKKSWQEYYFGGVPVIAAITEITKFQNDVRNAQSEVTNHLIKQIGAEDVKFDNLMAIVRSNTPAVFSGQKYQAEVFLGAYSSTQQFEATINGKTVPVENGKAAFETQASGIGSQPVKVNITYKDAKGQPQTLVAETEYQVFTGSATISAEKMNVLYIGLDNPIAVSVPGFRPDQVVATATGGMQWKGAGTPGHYIAKPDGSQREATVSVSVKMPDGTTKHMGQMLYRIRPVPNPEVMFGTKTGGAVSRGELATVSFVTAGLGPGFAFDGLKYDVTGYTLYFVPKVGGQPYIETVSGNRISAGAKAKFDQARPGDMIVITEVNAIGPTGRKVLNGPAMPVR